MSVTEGKQDYGTQPFMIQEEESVVDFLQRSTWFEAFTKFTQKHSELMQPHMNNGDYPNMEYAYPPYYDSPIDAPPGDGAEFFLHPQNTGCLLTCYPPWKCNEDIECHFSKSETPAGMDPREAPAYWQMEAFETNPDYGLYQKRVSGDRLSIVSHQTESDVDAIIRRGEGPATRRTKIDSIYPLRVAPPGAGWPYWPDEKSTTVFIRAMDAAGNICNATVDAWCRKEECCGGGSYVAVNFDEASTADTVHRTGSITIYALNGCAPFTWSETGTDFSLATLTTTARENTLTAGASACGACTITITDVCGYSDTIIVRCVTGSWGANVSSCPPGAVPPADSSGYFGGHYSYYKVYDKYEVSQILEWHGGSCAPPCDCCADTGMDACPGWADPAGFGTCIAALEADVCVTLPPTITNNCACYHNDGSYHRVWGC